MAKQFSAVVSGNEYLFPSGNVMMTDINGTALISFNGSPYNSSSTIEALVALANTGGTEQVQVSVLRVNDSLQVSAIQMSFPVSNITVNDSVLSNSNAVIVYNKVKYYVSETQASILSSANTGGGGSVSIPATAYASNAEALADGLVAGDLYKSAVIVNGSRQILIVI